MAWGTTAAPRRGLILAVVVGAHALAADTVNHTGILEAEDAAAHRRCPQACSQPSAALLLTGSVLDLPENAGAVRPGAWDPDSGRTGAGSTGAGNPGAGSSRRGGSGLPPATDSGSSRPPALAFSADETDPAASTPESLILSGDQDQNKDAPSESWGTISGGWPEVVVPALMVVVGVAAAGLAILRAAALAGRGSARDWLPCVFRASQMYQPSARVALLAGDGKAVCAGRNATEIPGDCT